MRTKRRSRKNNKNNKKKNKNKNNSRGHSMSSVCDAAKKCIKIAMEANVVMGQMERPAEMCLEVQHDIEVAMEKELNELVIATAAAKQEKMETDLKDFQAEFARFLEHRPHVDWGEIEKLPNGALESYGTLRERPLPTNVAALLQKLVVVKLNGALGSHMGFQAPHCLLSVRDEHTFLDLVVEQIEHLNVTYGCDVPLVLMNSYLTNEETQKTLPKYGHGNVRIKTFLQSRFPRINKETLLPVSTPDLILNGTDAECWHLPGHGDFYSSFARSGLLQQFQSEGRQVMFVSNMDNLGANVDLHLLQHMLTPPERCAPCHFIMEVTDRTRADVEGGTLIHYEGKLRLLEMAQVPYEHVDDFKSVSNFPFFNTNNLWISLAACERLRRTNSINMEIIANQRTLSNGLNCLQLERAIGAAMKCFDNALGVTVPRSRFLPVKKTSDLLLVRSNLYACRAGALHLNDQREFQIIPLIKLGDEFTQVKDLQARFANIPDLLELDHLTVSGNVAFGKDVVLKGTVIIIANHGHEIVIPSGSILENKIISGNLTVMDH
uniref:UTP--glucose-1-phosphate uridylyltransferase-like isoform X2 n=1 Tax=Myxine glutinosa TaxID=7769 RepID=UPI00358F1CA5